MPYFLTIADLGVAFDYRSHGNIYIRATDALPFYALNHLLPIGVTENTEKGYLNT